MIQSGRPPIQLPHHVDTYPRLQLSSVDLLVTEFQLNDVSLFDVWEDNQWKIIRTSTVIMVEKDRKLLLRLRKSLRDGLSLEECPGISDELALQPRVNGTKRSSKVQLVSPLKKAARVEHSATLESGSSIPQPIAPTQIAPTQIAPTQIAPTQTTSTQAAPTQAAPTQTTSTQAAPTQILPTQTALPQTPATNAAFTIDLTTEIHPAPVAATPPLQRLSILDMPVARWDAGWKKISRIIDDNPKAIERDVFPQVFGFNYCKSSVGKYKRAWKNAPPDLRRAFLQMGDVSEASWRLFTVALRNPDTWTPSVIDLTDTDPAKHFPVKLEEATKVIPTEDGPVLAPRSSEPSIPSPTAPTFPVPDVISAPAPFPHLSPLLDAHTHSALQAITSYSSSESDNEADPTGTLCPFCDQPFPENPSHSLMKRLDALKSISRPQASPSNPGHRWARSFTVYVDFCQQHTFEMDVLPYARQSGWPEEPNFAGLFARVLEYRSALTLLLHAPNKSSFFTTSAAYYKPGPSRLAGISSQYGSTRFTKQGAG